MKKMIIFLIAASFSAPVFAAGGDELVTVCNASGVCEAVPPEVAAMMAAIIALSDELNKSDSFGKSNDLVRVINELEKFVNNGMGPTNDFRRLLEDTGIDRLLQNLGIKLF